MWDLVRGAAQLKQPTPADLGAALHRDAGREPRPAGLSRAADRGPRCRCRAATWCSRWSAKRGAAICSGGRRASEAEARRAEVFDLAGVGARSSAGRRRRRADRAARHRLAPDPRLRPTATGAARRIGCAIGRAASSASVDELVDLDVEQIVLVSAAPESPGPHALAAPRLDGRGRLGEYLQSSEAAVVRDVASHGPASVDRASSRIRPAHNPVGPFDFARRLRRSIRPACSRSTELMSRGYEDAYHQFIEPVVGASGERVGQIRS